MQFRGLLQNPKFKRTVFTAIGFIILFLLWNIFVIGGDTFVSNGNAVISAVAALFASALFFRAGLFQKDSVSRPIWLSMGLGFCL